MSWDWNYAISIIPNLLEGMKITLYVTIIAYILALVLGMGFALAKMSSSRVLRGLTEAFSEGIRRTPLLVQLYVLFYVLPDIGIVLSPLAAGIIGLGLHNATYIAEVYRAGIANVPSGQWEAARACNLTYRQTWVNVIIPQAVPPMIPPLGNYLIAMFKETPLLAAITVLDLMGQAMAEADYSYRYLEPISMVAIGFLICSLTSAQLIKLAERKLRIAGT